MLQLIRWCVTCMALALASALGVMWVVDAPPESRLARLLQVVSNREAALEPSVRADAGGPFSLTDQRGRPVTEQTYRGKWMLVYFGYSYCPDICPTVLQTISSVLEQLGPQAADVAPIFITLDPKRDTVSAIGQYVALFDPQLIGLTGTEAQVSAAASAYRIRSRRVDFTGTNGYGLDHSHKVFLMNPDGKLKAVFPGSDDAAGMYSSVAASMSERKAELQK